MASGLGAELAFSVSDHPLVHFPSLISPIHDSAAGDTKWFTGDM